MTATTSANRLVSLPPPIRVTARQMRGQTARPFGEPARFQAYQQQLDFIMDQCRYPAFIGGRGSGKTASGSIKALQKALVPNSVGIIGAPSFPMLEQAAKPEFMRRLNAVALRDRRCVWYEKKSENKLIFPRLNAEVLFVTLDNYDRVRGINANWGWIDEAAYVPIEAWRVMVACVRIALDGVLPQLFITTTPKGRNWVYHEFVVRTSLDPRRQKRYHLYKATSYDNPFIYREYVEDLGYEGRFAEQEIGGDFVAFEGAVYPMFDRAAMVRRSPESALPDDLIPAVDTVGWDSTIGVDIGTRNPTAIVPLRVRPDLEWVHQPWEFYQRGLGSTEIVNAVERAYRYELSLGYNVTGVHLDPSAKGLIIDLGERDIPVVAADNDKKVGITRVTQVLSSGFSLDPSCVYTMAEYEAYAYPQGEARAQIDEPVKQNDHAMDGTRYGVMAIPMSSLAVGPVDDDLAEEYLGFTGH